METAVTITLPDNLPDSLKDFYLSLPEDDRSTLGWMEPELRNSILATRMQSALAIPVESVAAAMAAEIHEAIIETSSKTPEQLRFPFAPFPTEMTRTSPFFPMSTKERSGSREILENMVIAHHSWGQIRYSGPKLSVSDEDTLIVLLAYLNTTSSRTETEVAGRKTYLYRGSILNLLRLKGIKRPGKNHYDDLINSLKLLGRAQFELVTNRKNAQGKPAPKISIVSGIISGLSYDKASQELILAINPFFAETFAAGTVTLLDVATRLQLDSPVAKALYRFVQSHRDPEWTGHLITLATSLNLDIAGLPPFKLRERIKNAIAELTEEGTLSAKSCIKKDLVILVRSTTSEGANKKLPSPARPRRSVTKT